MNMHKRSKQKIILLLFFSFLQFFLPTREIDASSNALVIGTLSNTPNNEIKKLLPFSNYLSAQLGTASNAAAGNKSRVKVEKSVSKMAQLLQQGKVDLYLGNPFTSLALKRLVGIRHLVQTVAEGGDGKHYSVIFVRVDKPVKKLKEMKGMKIAFEDPFSSTGYLLPKWFLIENGLKLQNLKKETDLIPPDFMGYVFSRNDENSLLWVKKGKVDAAAVNYVNYKKQAKESLDQLKIVEKTMALPPLLLSYRADLPPEIIQNLKNILLKMHEKDDGKIILEQLDQVTSFREIPPKSLDPLMKSYNYLNSELNF